MISVAIVENDDFVRQTLSQWINSSPDYRCVAACRPDENVWEKLVQQRPDVVILDPDLPDGCGTAHVHLMAGLSRGHVIILSERTENDAILSALKAGAVGYLVKPSNREEILWAIAGAKISGAPMTQEIVRRLVDLSQRTFRASDNGAELRVSPRENEVLQLLSSGLINKQIAEQLGIAHDTVCVHLRRIYKKLHVRTRTQAAVKYLGRVPPQRNGTAF